MDRRAIFFFAAACICLVMSFVIDAELRYVPYWLAAVYVILGILSSLDAISRHRTRRPQ
jgi:hypothetical protein